METLRKIQTENATHLRIVKAESAKRKVRSTETLVANAWLFAQASLWEGQIFKDHEVTKFKKLIEEFFELNGYSEDSLIEFCERVILAKRYVARSSYRYLAAPALWLNIHYKFGISGTEEWYREVEIQRMSVPEYNLGMNILAISVAMYTSNPSPVTYRAARTKLIELKQFDLLKVFNSMITAFHYLNNQ